MRKYLVEIIVAAIAVLGFGVVIALPDSEIALTVRVNSPFVASEMVQADATVGAKVVRTDSDDFDASQAITIQFMWPCTDCDESDWMDSRLAMTEANSKAAMLKKDRCYEIKVTRDGDRTKFNSEKETPIEISC